MKTKSKSSEKKLSAFSKLMKEIFGPRLKKVIAFGKQEGWPKEEMQFLQEFLKEYGIGQSN